MKIAFVIDRWDPTRGGAERAMALLATHLEQSGHSAEIYAHRSAKSAPGNVHQIKRALLPRGALERAFARHARTAARRDQCDVVVGVRHATELDVYWPHGGLHSVTLAAGEASKGGVAGSVSRALHRVSPKHRAFTRMEDELLTQRRAGVVWCVSELVREEIAAAYPQIADRLEVHANGVDLSRFHPRLRRERRAAFLAKHRIDPSHPVMLFLGGNWHLKGWHVLADALRDVPGPWTLIAAGGRHGEARVRALESVPGKIVLLPQQDPADLFGAADLLVQPTFRDPCSLATLEALASGVPVITTRANGAADAIISESAGVVLEAARVADLASVLRHWLANVSVESVRTTEFAVEARRAAERRSQATWLDGLVQSLARVTSRRS